MQKNQLFQIERQIQFNEELHSKYAQQCNERAKHLFENAIKDLNKIEFCNDAETVQDNVDRLDRACLSIESLLRYQQRFLKILSRDSEH